MPLDRSGGSCSLAPFARVDRMDVYLPIAGIFENVFVQLGLGGAVGAQLGSRMGTALRAEHMRIVLALLVIAVSLRVLHDLTLPPIDTYSADISEY